VVISAAVGYRKPARAFFGEVIRLAGCAAGDVLFVGDDFENDYAGAIDAGLTAVLLGPRAKDPKASRVVSELRELV
jgi:putative hydrolase of the HAD superfamily